MVFVPAFLRESSPEDHSLVFAFIGNRVVIRRSESGLCVPSSSEALALGIEPTWRHYFGTWEGRGCYALCLPDDAAVGEGYDASGLRALFGLMDEHLVWVAGRASQLVHWHRNHRFCGRCGSPTQDHSEERAKTCPACGLINHPRVSPAIIVAVVRDHRLLLAHAKRFPVRFYSVLAGFTEPGESLEECVQREVFEEVGVRVADIRYFGSQPWPFPDSLMVAFTARHAEGEIRVNPAEITDAGWFAANELPEVPPRISIARQLIDWFAAHYSQAT